MTTMVSRKRRSITFTSDISGCFSYGLTGLLSNNKVEKFGISLNYNSNRDWRDILIMMVGESIWLDDINILT